MSPSNLLGGLFLSQIIQGDSLEELKKLADNSIDAIITDPPYGYSFMGKDWDRAVPNVEIWQECLRVLKFGAFCCVMSAPRSDVQCAMINRLQEAGFQVDFTPIYWTYATGFPKAANISKLVDKRLGADREITGKDKTFGSARNTTITTYGEFDRKDKPVTDEPHLLNGSYAGFQPKPAVEVIIVAMKPLFEKSYVDQALANGHGISWLDDCRIPSRERAQKQSNYDAKSVVPIAAAPSGGKEYPQDLGRFPANLLVSDDVLNDRVKRQSTKGGGFPAPDNYSRYFDLDKWAVNLPFLIVPKASNNEKNKGLDDFQEKRKWLKGGSGTDTSARESVVTKNYHPTVKPLKLMCYLITLFSRNGDTILDPFVGSGTTVLAAEKLKRAGIGIEREIDYVKIARARLEAEDVPTTPYTS